MENQQQKWVLVSLAAFSALVAYVILSLGMKIVGVYDIETRIRSIDMVMRIGSIVAGLILFGILAKNNRSSTFIAEVVSELSKVTWPTQAETTSATVVVMIMVLLSGVFLWLLDSLWVYVLQLVL